MKSILGRANEAHTLAVATVVVADRVEARAVEVHVARAVAIAVRGRPVAAVAAHTADRSPIAVAGGRQEDRTICFHLRPLVSRVAVRPTAIASGEAQARWKRPAVGQQYHAAHAIHLAVPVFRGGIISILEHVHPFVLRQCAPLACLVAAVVYRVVHAPVGIGIAASEVVGVAAAWVIVAI